MKFKEIFIKLWISWKIQSFFPWTLQEKLKKYEENWIKLNWICRKIEEIQRENWRKLYKVSLEIRFLTRFSEESYTVFLWRSMDWGVVTFFYGCYLCSSHCFRKKKGIKDDDGEPGEEDGDNDSKSAAADAE